MSPRSLALLAALSIGAGLVTVAPVSAQDQVQPEVANSAFQFAGVINANAVMVRSGPGEGYYPTMKLDKGAPVTVVGHKFGWLKIVPPEGSFSVVAKAFVDRPEGSNTGRVKGDSLNVRAGSALSPMKVTVQCKLKQGEEVAITGEQDEYYQIKPPAEAYVYVLGKFVDPVKQVAGPAVVEKPAETPATPGAAAQVATTPATQPSGTAIAKPAKSDIVAKAEVAPTTRPVEDGSAKAEAEFDRLEAGFAALGDSPLEKQPVEELLAGYEKLLAGKALSGSMRHTAEVRAAVLRIKADTKRDLVAMLKSREDARAKMQTLEATRTQIEQRLQGMVEVYAAIGTFNASSVTAGGQTLYRLTDPANGRTLCYVRSNDSAAVKLIGQFVAVKGEVGTDPQLTLKVVTATSMVTMDPARVNKGVTAQIVPPSVIGASSGN